jgi:hypothetical protein
MRRCVRAGTASVAACRATQRTPSTLTGWLGPALVIVPRDRVGAVRTSKAPAPGDADGTGGAYRGGHPLPRPARPAVSRGAACPIPTAASASPTPSASTRRATARRCSTSSPETPSCSAPEAERGPGAEADAPTFWQQYLAEFDEVSSEFTRVTEAGDEGILEWRSSGRLASGRDIDYRGVSLLTFDGDRVARFATYYDTAAFIEPTE